ncbi:Mbeg1-like protein [Oribacterium sp. HCP3S3_B9]|uniref:Mbeg1-like protein n=1 Tax=Oribacterium sp. HCP3S3_B9 TaxID=3438946 RepID=UPI003F8AF685
MANINEYLDWRGDVPFSLDPFNDVDNLILSELAYTDFEGIVPPPGSGESISLREAYAAFYQRHTRAEIEAETTFYHMAPFVMDHLIASRRFQNLRLTNYVNVIDEAKDAQFSAITFLLGREVPIALDCGAGDAAHARIQLPGDERETAYVAYRGTDDSIVGWKEDMNLSYQLRTPGQQSAVHYLDALFRGQCLRLMVGGHSKGGNFAVYASAFCASEVRRQICRIYTNDGPGFLPEITESTAYQQIQPKIVSTIPENSLIGILLTSDIDHHVVQATGMGIMQHDPLSWQVYGNHFVEAEKRTATSLAAERGMRTWLEELSIDQRILFIETLFDAFQSGGAHTFTELFEDKARLIADMLRVAASLPKEEQQELRHMLGEFARIGARVLITGAKSGFKR